MEIDTKSAHVTPVGGNVFADLGFAPEATAELKAESAFFIAESQRQQNEVLRRVGRNLLIFQQIEQLLKAILASCKAGGTIETFAQNQQDLAEWYSKRMLGQLVEVYNQDVLRDACVADGEIEEDRPEHSVWIKFQIDGGTRFVESIRQGLKQMTDERNDLVHHFLPRWQPNSGEKLDVALWYLDNQRDKVKPLYEHLQTVASSMNHGREKLQAFLCSEQFEAVMELGWIQASPLVSLMCQTATKTKRQDGWAYLSQAGQAAVTQMPEEIRGLKECYGYSTLKQLMAVSQMFDMFDEPLPSGAHRTLYRVKKT